MSIGLHVPRSVIVPCDHKTFLDNGYRGWPISFVRPTIWPEAFIETRTLESPIASSVTSYPPETMIGMLSVQSPNRPVTMARPILNEETTPDELIDSTPGSDDGHATHDEGGGRIRSPSKPRASRAGQRGSNER